MIAICAAFLIGLAGILAGVWLGRSPVDEDLAETLLGGSRPSDTRPGAGLVAKISAAAERRR